MDINKPNQKIIMRKHLEHFLQLYRELERQIDICTQEIEDPEYHRFLEQLKTENKQHTRLISNYMVRKCNR